MKKLKYIIIGLTIAVIIIVSILLKIIIDKKIEYRKQEGSLDVIEQGDKVVLRDAGNPVKDATIYYTVENCVKKYLEYCGMQVHENEEEDNIGSRYDKVDISEVLGITSQQEKNQVIYNILEKNYVQDNNINLNNINEYITEVGQNTTFKTIHMNEVQGEKISKYSVYGKIQDKNKEQDICMIVNLDIINATFSIHPLKEEKDINEILFKKDIEQIERNDNNVYTYIRMTTEDVLRKYVDDYKNKVLNDIEGAFGVIQKEYREARFSSLSEFEKYLENNKQKIMRLTPMKYKIDETEEYTQYTILDQNEDYYIFRETGVMEYRVILDTYTIDLPEFLEKYNTASEQEKVAMNINKFIEAINAKDYAYAYSKIADSFKENYFKTQKSFEDYIKTHFYERNTITFNNFKNQANTYIYTTIITDKATNQRKEQNFIVRLKEGTDFEMSFEV